MNANEIHEQKPYIIMINNPNGRNFAIIGTIDDGIKKCAELRNAPPDEFETWDNSKFVGYEEIVIQLGFSHAAWAHPLPTFKGNGR